MFLQPLSTLFFVTFLNKDILKYLINRIGFFPAHKQLFKRFITLFRENFTEKKLTFLDRQMKFLTTSLVLQRRVSKPYNAVNFERQMLFFYQTVYVIS